MLTAMPAAVGLLVGHGRVLVFGGRAPSLHVAPHLHFRHHVVIRLHVYGEGLSHLSFAVVQDLNLHQVFPLALLELDVLERENEAKRINAPEKAIPRPPGLVLTL